MLLEEFKIVAGFDVESGDVKEFEEVDNVLEVERELVAVEVNELVEEDADVSVVESKSVECDEIIRYMLFAVEINKLVEDEDWPDREGEFVDVSNCIGDEVVFVLTTSSDVED